VFRGGKPFLGWELAQWEQASDDDWLEMQKIGQLSKEEMTRVDATLWAMLKPDNVESET
jgi:hypothetical protein